MDEAVDESVDDGYRSCDFCGETVDQNWLALDVVRPLSDSDRTPEYLDFCFCSQDHASRFLAERTLPAPEAPTEVDDPDWRGRFLDVLFGLAVLLSCVLMVVGSWTLVQAWLSS